jgi:hypothetical protein
VFKKILGWLQIGSLDRGDHTSASDRPIENADALAAAVDRNAVTDFGGDSNYPPGYVKAYDEGRPRK